MHAATITKNAACARPTFTHFISVPDRVFALISVVCGLEQAAAITSYVIPAAARNATPRRCVAEVPTGMSAADGDRVGECRRGPGEPGVPARRSTEADHPGSPGSKNGADENGGDPDHASLGCTDDDSGAARRRALPVLHVVPGSVGKLRAASALRGDDRRAARTGLRSDQHVHAARGVDPGVLDDRIV